MTQSVALSLVEAMTLQAGDGKDQFIGPAESYGIIGVYGGHLIGQALAAGFKTVDEPRLAQSLHAYFVSPGNPEMPLEYRVDRLREGRGSDLRNIQAWQAGKLVFHMAVSFKLMEDADEHQPVMPAVAGPDDLRPAADASGIQFAPPPTKDGRAEMVLASDHFMVPEFKPGREAVLKLWMRCCETGDLTDRMSQILLAYLSDGPLMFNSVIPHGIPFQTHRLTSIDHAAWFHRPHDAAEWMFFDQHSSAAADGRGMNHGVIFAENGQLVMTVAQESLLRRIRSG